VIEELRGHEQNLTNLSTQTYKNLKQYQTQNNVILESLKEEILNADNQLKSMIVEVPTEEIELIKHEIEEEFTKSLEGYTINKNKYPHLRELDPKEINEISQSIKKDLLKNDKFYLHGDFNLF
jgi:predicted Rossmann fold nucleotide-binding protein DprA/Smf involved in DNA uptake